METLQKGLRINALKAQLDLLRDSKQRIDQQIQDKEGELIALYADFNND